MESSRVYLMMNNLTAFPWSWNKKLLFFCMCKIFIFLHVDGDDSAMDAKADCTEMKIVEKDVSIVVDCVAIEIVVELTGSRRDHFVVEFSKNGINANFLH